MPPLQLLIKPSSEMCNLRCKYCFYHDVAQNRVQESYGFMTAETLENVVKKAFDYAERSCAFAFQGGEPTLIGLNFFEIFIDLVEKYNIKKIPVQNSIQTNGYGLNEKWAEFFSKNKFLVGLSLDGVNVTHDAYRVNAQGEGTFGEIMATTELFNRCKVEYNTLTVVNRRTAEKIRRIYSFYKKNGFHYLQFIACLDPLGEAPGQREYSLTPEIYGKFLVELFDLWYLDYLKGQQPYIRMFENYIAILVGYEPESCEQRGRCSIQHVVEADGSVYPCDFYVVDQYRIGNLNSDSIETIDENGRNGGFLEHSLNEEGCKGCTFHFICRGGCKRHRCGEFEAGFGNNYFCKSYKMLFEAALPRMRQIAADLMRR